MFAEIESQAFAKQKKLLSVLPELADKALALNPNDADIIGDLGNFSYYSGDLERGKELVGRMMEINPRYPSWAHFVFFLDHFRNDRFPEALAEVVKITLPNHCFIQWSKVSVVRVFGTKSGAN